MAVNLCQKLCFRRRLVDEVLQCLYGVFTLFDIVYGVIEIKMPVNLCQKLCFRRRLVDDVLWCLCGVFYVV